MKYLHIVRSDNPELVSTVRIYKDGHVAFLSNDEYSIQDLKDVIAEAEFELDNRTDDGIDLGDDDDWQEFWDDFNNGFEDEFSR